MMEEFHVVYLAYYPWQDPEEGPDKLVSCRLLACSEDEARRLAIEKIPQVITGYTDEGDEVTADIIEVRVRPWAAWGNQLDRNWEAICNVKPEENEE